MSHIRFSRALVFAALAVSLIIPATAAARSRVAVGFGFFGAPFYGYGPYGYPYGYGYSPYGYAPYGYAPYGPYGYSAGRAMGQVHIKSPNSDAQIYINGSFAGRAHDLKTIYLAPGTYNIEQRIGTDVQKEKIYVLANRSLKIEFDKPGQGTSGAGPRPEANPPEPAPRPEANSAPQPAPAPNPAPGSATEVQR